MANEMMKCGHSANATDNNNKPCCVMCVMAGNEDAKVVVEAPDLTNRKAQCSYGHKIVPSSTNLAFFEYCPDKEFDNYYCGCYGWD